MLIFNDAYKLAQANQFIFEMPTVYNEIVLRGTTERIKMADWIKIRINAKFTINKNISTFDGVSELIEFLNEAKIDTIELSEFKEFYNETMSVLEIMELDEQTEQFTLREEEDEENYEDDEDYEEEEDDEEDKDKNEHFVIRIKWM